MKKAADVFAVHIIGNMIINSFVAGSVTLLILNVSKSRNGATFARKALKQHVLHVHA